MTMRLRTLRLRTRRDRRQRAPRWTLIFPVDPRLYTNEQLLVAEFVVERLVPPSGQLWVFERPDLGVTS